MAVDGGLGSARSTSICALLASILIALSIVLAGCGGSGAAPIEALSCQWADEPAEAAWKPCRSSDEIPREGPSRTIWFRVEPPAVDAPDPALRVGWGSPIEEVRVDGRRVAAIGTPVIVPLPAPAKVVLLRVRPRGEGAFVPAFGAGSQRALWASALVREVPELCVAGILILASLLLVIATLRRGGARAYRGLGVFLGSLGVLTLLQLELLKLVLFDSPDRVFYLHEAAGFLYPIGFAEFALAIFGDGRLRVIGRGLRVYMIYVAGAVGLCAARVLAVDVIRQPANVFMLVFTAQALAIAARRARGGDRAARAFLLGIGALIAISLPDIADGIGLASFEFQTVPYGVLAFGLAMAVVIERRLAETRDALAENAVELSRKVSALEDRNRDVDTLNAELRHQIAERSRQLSDALRAGVVLPLATRALEPGEIVDGRYRVVRPLGRGGMGAVHEVVRVSDDRRFALKVMASEASGSDAARFAREAEIAARIADPHLVPVVDVGADRGLLYLVMELVDGHPLHQQRDRFGDVAWSRDILAQVASALATLHGAGVVHRDLKPGNVLLTRGEGAPTAKLSDFGISRFGAVEDDDAGERSTAPLSGDADSTLAPKGSTSDLWAPAETRIEPTSAPDAPASSPTRPTLTQTGALIGTPAYMAPELARGARRARPSSDMFAFGLMAYEMLAARPAFPSPPIILAITDGALPAVDPLPEGVDAEVAALVLACLDLSPDRRPPASEAARVLSRSP